MKPIRTLAAALAFAACAAHATPVVVDVTGAQSVNLFGEAGNTVLFVNIGAGSVLNAVSWNLTLNALAPSLLSEMQVSFGSASGLDAVNLAPGVGVDTSGTGSYAGAENLAPLNLSVGSDGVLRLEFSETSKDFGLDVAEGQWLSGNLTFDVSPVPEPASMTLALLGLGVIGARARRVKRD